MPILQNDYFSYVGLGVIYPKQRLREVVIWGTLMIMMDSIRIASQRTLLVYALFFSLRSTDVLAHFICPNEQIELECHGLDSVIQIGTYEELQWWVTDPEHLKKRYVGYCNKTLQCTRYKNIGRFESRIQVSSPIRGKLLVKQMKLNDQLTYTCAIERNGNKGPLAYKTIVTSSKHCLSSTAGEDLDLGQTFHVMFSKEPVADVEWYRITQDGTKVKMAQCSPSSSCRLVENCISSCPEYLKRLKTDGLSIILSNVTQADRGLEFQMQMHFKTMTKGPRVHLIKIKDISPREAADDVNRKTFKTTRSTTSTTGTSAADTTAHSTGNNPGSYSVQNSWLVSCSVVISLMVAPYAL